MDDLQNSWICPNDETVNTGEYCVICGSPRPVYDLAPEPPEPPVLPPEPPVLPPEPPVLLTEPDTDPVPVKDEQKKSTVIPVLLGALGIVAIVVVLLFVGSRNCWFGHSWAPATCTAPMTCLRCSETTGTANGHSASPATCTSDSYCAECATVLVPALGHHYLDATCTEPMRCSRCPLTSGQPLGHFWPDRNGASNCLTCDAYNGSYSPLPTGSLACSTGTASFSLWQGKRWFSGLCHTLQAPLTDVNALEFRFTFEDVPGVMPGEWGLYLRTNGTWQLFFLMDLTQEQVDSRKLETYSSSSEPIEFDAWAFICHSTGYSSLGTLRSASRYHLDLTGAWDGHYNDPTQFLSGAYGCTEGGKTHYFKVITSDHYLTWAMAQEYCRYLGGHMATLETPDQNITAYACIQKADFSHSIYFGLSDEAKEGTWVWEDGTPLTYSEWHPAEPNGWSNENFACFYPGYSDTPGVWNDGNYYADWPFRFICEWEY